MTEYPTYMTLEQLAQALSISPRGLAARMKKRGHFGGTKVGRRWFFPASVLTSKLALPG